MLRAVVFGPAPDAPEHHGELAALHREARAVQRADLRVPRAVGLHDVVKLYVGHGFAPANVCTCDKYTCAVSSRGPCPVCHGVDLGRDRIGVADVVLVEHVEVAVERIDERHARGNVDLEDLLWREPLELHDERAQRVAVRGDEHALASEHLRADDLLEVGPGAGDAVLQTLGIGQLVCRDIAVHVLGVRVALVTGFERGGARRTSAATRAPVPLRARLPHRPC